MRVISGYYKTSTENYDICWTMCHCVMVLHLIGLTFDVSDSVKKPEVLGITDDRPVKIPDLLEVFAFAYFPPTVIIGPQFSFQRYSKFLEKKFEGTKNFEAGLKRFLTGVVYLAVYQGLTFIVPDGYFMTDDFANRNFPYKLLMVSIWGRCTLYKYISCWILSEGAAICCGNLAFKSFNALSVTPKIVLSQALRLCRVTRKLAMRTGAAVPTSNYESSKTRTAFMITWLRSTFKRTCGFSNMSSSVSSFSTIVTSVTYPRCCSWPSGMASTAGTT